MTNVEEMETLARSMPDFSPTAWFEPKMDQLVFHSCDEPYDEHRIDNWLTVFFPYDNPVSMTGFKLKGFNWLYQRAVVHGFLDEGGFLELVDLLDYAWILAVSAHIQEKPEEMSTLDPTYKQAKDVANDYKINKSDLGIIDTGHRPETEHLGVATHPGLMEQI